MKLVSAIRSIESKVFIGSLQWLEILLNLMPGVDSLLYFTTPPNETSSNQSQILVISFIFIFIGDEKSLQKAEGTYNTECRLG
jgi:hypothetical protein